MILLLSISVKTQCISERKAAGGYYPPLQYSIFELETSQPSSTTISFTLSPGFLRQVKSMAQKLLYTSRFRPW